MIDPSRISVVNISHLNFLNAYFLFNLFLILIMVNQSCMLNSLSGSSGINSSIKESKERGVFISEYFTSPNPYKINDSMAILVKSAWLENYWQYDGFFNEKTKIYNNFQFRIITDSISLKGFIGNWFLIRDNPQESFFLRADSDTPYAITSGFNNVPNSDTILWKAQKRVDNAHNGINDNLIGKFILIRKN